MVNDTKKQVMPIECERDCDFRGRRTDGLMGLKSRAVLLKKPTPPPHLFTLLVRTREKSSGVKFTVNSFRK